MQRRHRRGDEGREDAQRMPARGEATDRAQRAGDQHPVQHQVRADFETAAPEAPRESTDHEERQDHGEPREGRLLLHRFEFRTHRERRGRVFLQVLRHALQVARADDRQHFARTVRGARAFAQARGHVAVAFADHRFVQDGAFVGEFAEAGFEQVALLQLLDFVVADFFIAEQRRDDAATEFRAPPPTQALRCTLEREADIAVDQVHASSLPGSIR